MHAEDKHSFFCKIHTLIVYTYYIGPLKKLYTLIKVGVSFKLLVDRYVTISLNIILNRELHKIQYKLLKHNLNWFFDPAEALQSFHSVQAESWYWSVFCLSFCLSVSIEWIMFPFPNLMETQCHEGYIFLLWGWLTWLFEFLRTLFSDI